MTAIDAMGAEAKQPNQTLAVLQRIGRSLMMPIAVLPAAGLLLRLGQYDVIDNIGLKNVKVAHDIADVIGGAGGVLFDNLPLLFAIGVAIGFARKADGSTALAALVGMLVFDKVSRIILFKSSYSTVRAEVSTKVDGVEQLNPGAHNPTWVIGGIVIGIVSALLWQRYHRIKLPAWLAFFGGRRFVPIVTALAGIGLGVVFGLVWPFVGQGLHNFSEWLANQGAAGTGVYGVINRLLIPFGLHHIVNSLVWFTFGDFKDATGAIVHGDLTRFFAKDPDAGGFMAGFFPIMMFGLPAAALAMWQEARPEKRALIGGIMFSGALCSFLTGVTEPLEFAFLFVAPLLFVVHALLTGSALVVCSLLGIKDGFSFSAGAIDYALNFLNPGLGHNRLLIIPIGLVYAAVYYFLFRFLIRKFNLMTPGRERDNADLVEVGEAETAAPAPAAART
jgi:PTS system N-acetylglucosamine-specific IIC component